MKIGNANTKDSSFGLGLFLCYRLGFEAACKCPSDTCRGRTIVTLVVKIGNTNTEALLKCWCLF